MDRPVLDFARMTLRDFILCLPKYPLYRMDVLQDPLFDLTVEEIQMRGLKEIEKDAKFIPGLGVKGQEKLMNIVCVIGAN
ncbi:hypothetical protein B9057_02600 [Aestuarium zhoushanense]|nr:hypothetical protein B9057_02600 [Aestuarium zhoushanense]